MTRILKYSLCIYILIFSSCSYGFKGISIPANVKTYYVDQFALTYPNAPGELPELFMEALRQKIRNQSSLSASERNPDIEFLGEISDFRVENVAESAENNTAASMKLIMTVQVEFVSNKNEDDGWGQNFSHFVVYDPSIDFQTAQETFLDEILDQLTEQIFNKSFANW